MIQQVARDTCGTLFVSCYIIAEKLLQFTFRSYQCNQECHSARWSVISLARTGAYIIEGCAIFRYIVFTLTANFDGTTLLLATFVQHATLITEHQSPAIFLCLIRCTVTSKLYI